MSAAAATSYETFGSQGSSAEAKFITREQKQFDRTRWQTSYFLGEHKRGAFHELSELQSECAARGWDGYQAQPIHLQAIMLTQLFLEALPLNMSAPSIGAEPDGHITLEWYKSPRRVLSVSVTPDFELHYAALIGASRHYGTEPFHGEIPRAIFNLVTIITEHA